MHPRASRVARLLLAPLVLSLLPLSARAAGASLPSAPAPIGVDARVSVRQAPAPGGWRDKCMALFQRSPGAFGECEQNTCFLFIQEPPYIVLDDRMKTAGLSAEEPFPCSKPPDAFNRLHGAAFQIMQQTPAASATCAFAGPNCLFNDAVEFIKEASRDNPRIKLAMTGLLLETQQRLSAHILPSISLMVEEMVVIGLRENAEPQEWFPLTKMVKPFQDAAWGIFAGVVLLLWLYTFLLAVLFGPRPVSMHGLFYFYLGDFSEADIATGIAPPTPEEAAAQAGAQPATSGGVSGIIGKLKSFATWSSRQDTPSTDTSPRISEDALHKAYVERVSKKLAAYRVCVRLLAMSMGAVVVIFLIFYEMAVVNSLFVEQKLPLKQKLGKDIKPEELKTFSVQQNAATETVFRSIIDPGNKRFPPGSEPFPWKRCENEAQCFDYIFDKSEPVDKFVGFKTIGTYEIIKRDACSKLSIFETDGYRFGAGWLFGNSSGTDPEYRRSIDKAILNLQFSDSLREIVLEATGSLDARECKRLIERIEIGVIGVGIFFFVAPFLVIALLIMLWQVCGGRQMLRGFRRRSRFMSRLSRRDVDDLCRSSRAELRQREGEAFLVGRRTPAD